MCCFYSFANVVISVFVGQKNGLRNVKKIDKNIIHPVRNQVAIKLNFTEKAMVELKSLRKRLISTNLSKHVSVTFGQTEKWAFLVFGLFHLSLLRKVHQSP